MKRLLIKLSQANVPIPRSILSKYRPTLKKLLTVLKGGQGSGNFGHEGRPGEVGGSGEGSGIPIPKGREWVDSLPHLPKDTLEHYTSNGQIIPERANLHAHIIKEATDKIPSVPPDQNPVAIVMMGGTASGKSSLVNGLSKDDFVRVDADAMKEKLPEYREAIEGNARNAASIVHEESSYLAKAVRDVAISGRKNLIFDGTGKDANKYEAMIKNLKDKGYEVTLLMPDIDVETAKERAITRAERSGRWVPPSFIEGAYATIPRNFDRISNVADHARLYDNRGPKPRLVLEKHRGKETIHDEPFVRRFRQAS